MSVENVSGADNTMHVKLVTLADALAWLRRGI